MKYLEIVEIIDNEKIIYKDINGKKYFYKELSVYNLSVFEWLKDHPCMYVPRIYDYEEINGHLLVLEEFIDGDTLESILSDLGENDKYMILSQILDGISFLHHAAPPIIHRDIKPANIMVTHELNVKIIDYDAAKIVVKNEPRDTVLLGTQGSAAPEQYGFGSSDARTDIYAIGVLIRELFPNKIKMLEVADKCTEMKPDERYQTIQELRKAIHFPKDRFKINIPGFRNGNILHMIIAIIGYAGFTYTILSSDLHRDGVIVTDPAEILFYRCIYFVIFFALVDLFTHWSGIYDHFPFMESKNIILKLTGYMLAITAISWIIGILVIVFELII